MRQVLNQFSLMLSVVFLVSCASAIPPARIGDYVSSERQVGDDAVHENRSATTAGRACRGVGYGRARCGSESCRKRRWFALEKACNGTLAVRFLLR